MKNTISANLTPAEEGELAALEEGGFVFKGVPADIDMFTKMFVDNHREELSFDLDEMIMKEGTYAAYKKAEHEICGFNKDCYLILPYSGVVKWKMKLINRPMQ